MMSRCFTWFPIGGLGKPKLYHDSRVFYKKVGILLGGCLTVKNEWELIAGDDGVGLGEYKIYHQLVDFSIMGDLNRKVVIK